MYNKYQNDINKKLIILEIVKYVTLKSKQI